ncbi:MAG TPA: preprotein translocase subunit SecG [Pyrinomonadaceae bacterium]|nr:preprotein translocase subunit SecG [Pyrinomonadaceae bacterium]
MIYFLYALFFISCLALVVSVLLQPGKTDAGALFTSNISSSAFTPRGAQTVLSKITIASATVFMLAALFIAMPALQGDGSVLNANPETATEQPATSNTNTAANADSNANSTANANATATTNAATNTTANAPANAPANKPANAPANANK